MVTLKMLARECNVSIATVSKALNGAPDVGADTTARIQQAARKLGYIPSAAARNLKTNRSNCFGVIFDDGTNSGLSHDFFAVMLESFKRSAENLGYDLVLISGRPGPWGSDYLTHAKYRNCDGVLILVGEDIPTAAQDILHSGIPVVVIDYWTDNCSAVRSDNVQGMRDLVRYIYEQGHRRIGAVFGEDSPVTRRRTASFYRTCAELGLEIPDPYVISALYHDPDSSALATRRLLELKERPTCILYPDDFSVLGGLGEIERQGMSVPEDISIAGFDGSLLARNFRPRFTTVRQDNQTMGEVAAKELARAVEEGRRFIARETVVPCELLPGETVRKL